MRKIKAGFVGFGEVNTPREMVERLCREALSRLPEDQFDLIVTDPVRDDPGGQEAARAVAELGGHDLDVLLVCVAGWIPSHTVFQVIDPFRNTPMVLWGLSGWRENGRIVTTACQAGTTALRQPMAEMGYVFEYHVETLDGGDPVPAIGDFARAARAAALLRGARIGQMGFRDMNLYATLYDGMALRAKIGVEVEFFEMLEIARTMEDCDAATLAQWRKVMEDRWHFTRPAQPQTLENSIRLAWALQRKIHERSYQGLSFKDVDGVKKLLGFAPAGAMTLLHEHEESLCTIPENDTLGAVTQLMVRQLTGQCAAYLEFYDFFEKGALMGVPDYVPPQIVQGSVCVTPTAFGGFGEGLLNVSKIRTGPVTLMRLAQSGGRHCLHAFTGLSMPPPAWEEAGWQPPAPQLPSLRVDFDIPMRAFQNQVMGQHYILAHGDHLAAVRALCRILDIQFLAS